MVIAAMRNHRADSAMWPRIVKQAPEIAFRVELQIELQCWATFTLANLAMHPDISLHIARAGGMDVIIAAMRTHKACIREREKRERARAQCRFRFRFHPFLSLYYNILVRYPL